MSAGPSFTPALLRLLGVLAVAAVVFGMGLGGVHLLRHSTRFALRQIHTSPTVHVSREALLKLAALQIGENLFQLDLARAERDLAAAPWLRHVRVRRELPFAVAIDVEEYQPKALVALGSLYLCDGDGVLFKRATPDEALGLPVLTGIGRDAYVIDRADSQTMIREALLALAAFAGARRPTIGEVHVDLSAGLTLYTSSGVAIRLGQTDATALSSRLAAFDAVWAELNRRGERPSLVFLDNRAHPEHVTVRMETPAVPPGDARGVSAVVVPEGRGVLAGARAIREAPGTPQ